MSSEKEGKIPTLCKELVKTLELWDSKAFTEDDDSTANDEILDPPQKNQLFSSIKEQLENF